MVRGTAIPNHTNTYGSISMIIYLYIKQHSITDLKYFGMTKQKDPFKYLGSGKYWRLHLNKHGYNIKTIEIWGFDDQQLCTEFALKFSKENNIARSNSWANLMDENGHNCKGVPGLKHSTRSIEKMRNAQLGKKLSEETKLKISESNKKPKTEQHRLNIIKGQKGRIFSSEHKEKMKIAQKNVAIVECNHCHKVGKITVMKRWHFNNCKLR